MAALTGSVNPDSLEPPSYRRPAFDGESQGSSPPDDWHGYHPPRPGDLSTPPNRFTHDPPRGIATSASIRRLRCPRMPQNAPRPCPDIPASDCLERRLRGAYEGGPVLLGRPRGLLGREPANPDPARCDNDHRSEVEVSFDFGQTVEQKLGLACGLCGARRSSSTLVPGWRRDRPHAIGEPPSLTVTRRPGASTGWTER